MSLRDREYREKLRERELRAERARRHEPERSENRRRTLPSEKRISAELCYRSYPVEVSYEEDEPFPGREGGSGRTGPGPGSEDGGGTARSGVREAAGRQAFGRRAIEAGGRGIRGRDRGAAGRDRHGRRKGKGRGRALLLFLLFVVLLYTGWSFASRYIGKKYWTVAVFGVDSRDGNLGEGALSDVIMLASINRRSGELRLVSVFRDTYARIDEDNNYHKLNEAYFKGGHEQALKALEANLDLEIDDYVSFNWAAVAKAISALGGVDLELSDAEFYYINAFITETVESTGIASVHLEHAGANHLDGVQAVAYGRLRLMDTDFHRTARQRKVLGLALEKAKHAGPATLLKVAQAVLPELSTSLDAGDFAQLAQNAGRYELSESKGFPFARTTKKIRKMDCVIPATLSSNVKELHRFLYDKEDYEPSALVQKISAHIAEISGVTESAEDAAEAQPGGGSAKSAGSGKKQKEQTTAPETTESMESSIPESSAEESSAEAETAGEDNREELSGGAAEEENGSSGSGSSRSGDGGNGSGEGSGGAVKKSTETAAVSGPGGTLAERPGPGKVD